MGDDKKLDQAGEAKYVDNSSLEKQSTEITATMPTDVTSLEEAPVPGVTKQQDQRKLWRRIMDRVTSLNIYLVAFIVIIIVGLVVIYVAMREEQQSTGKITVTTGQDISQDALDDLLKKDTTIGDVSKTLTVEANAIFNGKILIKDNLDVAGSINVGGPLTLPGITVAGSSAFDDVRVSNNLAILGNATIQGTVTIQRNLSVSGEGTFGSIAAGSIAADSIEFNGDARFTRHLDAGGPPPTAARGGAVGSGGTVSVNGTDTAGTVSINTGSGSSTGNLATITFARAFHSTPHVVITPVGSKAGRLDYYVSRGASSFTISTASAPTSNSAYIFDFIVIE